jgi:hypothetical protein
MLGWFGARGLLDYFTRSDRERHLGYIYIGILASLACVPVGLVGLVWYGLRREREALHAMCGPIRFALDEKGVSGDSLQGATFECEWSCFAGFHIGQSVVVLPKSVSQDYLRIPLGGMSPDLQSELVTVLRASLKELSRNDLRSPRRRKGPQK